MAATVRLQAKLTCLEEEIMFQHYMKWIVLVCALLLLFPADASAKKIKGHFSGSGFTSAFDSNGDGENSAISVLHGKLSQIGKFTARARDESFPWDGVSWCSATEIQIAPLSMDTIFTAANGDMFWTQLDGSSNDLCFDVFDDSMRRTFLNQIVGGTGRFTGASGYLACELTGQGLRTPLGDFVGAVFEGECEGELE